MIILKKDGQRITDNNLFPYPLTPLFWFFLKACKQTPWKSFPSQLCFSAKYTVFPHLKKKRSAEISIHIQADQEKNSYWAHLVLIARVNIIESKGGDQGEEAGMQNKNRDTSFEQKSEKILGQRWSNDWFCCLI